MFPWSTTDLWNSEQHEEIRELKANHTALKGFPDDTEKSFDHVKLSLDRCESQVKRLSQRYQELQETLNVFQESVEFKHLESAISEVSGRTCNSIVDRNHVSGANFASRNVANSLRRDVLESLFKFHFSSR